MISPCILVCSLQPRFHKRCFARTLTKMVFAVSRAGAMTRTGNGASILLPFSPGLIRPRSVDTE